MTRTLQVTCTILLVGILVMTVLAFLKQQDIARESHSSRRILERAFVKSGQVCHLRSKGEAIEWLREQGFYWNSITEEGGTISFREDDRTIARLDPGKYDPLDNPANFPWKFSIYAGTPW
jgi:hypothetical protein